MVRRALKWILPFVLLVEVVLTWLGIMELRDAVLVVAGLETLFLLIGLGGFVLVVRRYRRERKDGLDPWMALENSLSLVLPQPAARLVLKEPRIFACLLRWTFRRIKYADNEFCYHKRSVLRAIIPLLVVSAPMELVIVHVLALAFSPWEWLKWALLILGVYATLWIFGLYASLVDLPHRLERTGLRLRHGVLAEGFVPYTEIEEVVREERRAPTSGDGLSYAPEQEALYLATDGKTDLALRLKTQHSMMGFIKESAPAGRFHLTVNDPDQFVRQIRQRVEAETTASGTEADRSPVPNGN